MPKNHFTKYNTFEEVRTRLKSLYPGKRRGGWRAVAEIISTDEMKITFGMVHQIAVKKIEPKDNEIRKFFNLPPMIDFPACPVCGEAHPRKTCPTQVKPREKKRIRIEIDPDISRDDLAKIHAMTPQDRTEILLNWNQ